MRSPLLIHIDYFIIRAKETGEMVKNNRGMRLAKRFLLTQVILTLLISLVVGLMSGIRGIMSVWLGGLVSIIPNAYFAMKLFRHQGARAARKIVGSFYQGEAVKILLTMVLFILVFLYGHVMPLVFFITYILVQMVFWFAPLLFEKV